jgi:hypothetical protein
VWNVSRSKASNGKNKKIISAPNIAIKILELLLVNWRCFSVVVATDLRYLRYRMTPKAKPIKPPKVKILNVPKLS